MDDPGGAFRLRGNQAQVYYSTDPRYMSEKKEGRNLLTTYENAYPDTALTHVSEFFPRNFSGNYGLPSPEYHIGYGADEAGFRFFRPPLLNDRFLAGDARYYRSMGPFAELTGIAGSRELQVFKTMFTHTYRSKPNVAIRFNRYTSKGFYQKQQTYTNNFLLTSNHTGRRGQAGYYFYLLNNSNRNQENGGILDERLTDSTMALRKELLPVRLSVATRDNRETAAMLNPWLRLNGGDSTRRADHFIEVKNMVSFSSYRYKDDAVWADKFYSAAFLDTATTKDSANFRQFRNSVSYVARAAKGGSGFSLGYRNEVNDVWQKQDSVFMNHLAMASFVYRPSADTAGGRPLESALDLQYVLQGVNSGNIRAESNTVFIPRNWKRGRFTLDLLYDRRNPDYIHNRWVSNHFMWLDNGYKVQDQLQARAAFQIPRTFSVSVFYQDISGFLYFDQYALPRQLGDGVQNIGLRAQFSRVFFRHLGIYADHTYQQTSAPSYLRIPPNVFTGRLYLNAHLFRKNLWLQLGGQLQAFDTYYPYAYMPATQVFYIQEEMRADPYPYVDVFLQGRIRPVSFFLKVENLLQGYSGSHYSLMPGYYQPDRAFRMGISWMFFD
jgi:hypothetical protein